MRILHTLAEKSLGGLEFRTLEQARWLHRHGHDVAIAAPADSDTLAEARLNDMPTVEINFHSAYSPATIFALRRAVKTLGIDVIDTHSRADGKTAALCRDLCTVVRTRHFAKPMPTSARRRLEWRLGCDHVIATSNMGRQELLAARLAAPEKISVVGEWADEPFFGRVDTPRTRARVRRDLGIDADAYVVTTIGMLRPEKGQADLVRVVQRLRCLGVPAHALIVGMPTKSTEPYAYKLNMLARDLQIADHVTFAGHRTDVADMIRASDVVLVPSAAEAWSRVVPESYAAGCPVVASNVGGLPQVVLPGRTGWLANPGDVAAFTERIMEIRQHPDFASAIVARARAFAEANFRLPQQMANTLEVYRRAMGGKPST